MNTVFTPDAVKSMVAKGRFRKIKLKDFIHDENDEAHIFIFPSRNVIDEVNGDGEFLEIEDWKDDFTEISTYSGKVVTTPDTEIYVC